MSENSSDDEWEEIDGIETKGKAVEVQLNSETLKQLGVDIPISKEEGKDEDKNAEWEKEVRRELTRRQRDLAENSHRVQIISVVAHLRFLASSVLNKRTDLSIHLGNLGNFNEPLTVNQMTEFVRCFRKCFKLENPVVNEEQSDALPFNSSSELIQYLKGILDSRKFSRDIGSHK